MATAIIRPLVADEHGMVRQGAHEFLAEPSSIKVTVEASDGATTVRM